MVHLDEANAAMLRRVLDHVLTDPRFNAQTSVSAVQVAEHIWRQAAIGVRDFDQMRYSALSLLTPVAEPRNRKTSLTCDALRSDAIDRTKGEL